MNEEDKAIADSMSQVHLVTGQDLRLGGKSHNHADASLKEVLFRGVSLDGIRKHLNHGAPAPVAGDELGTEVSAVELVDGIIRSAIDDRATDIHFDPQDGQMRVRFRIDGMLYDTKRLSAGIGREVTTRLKVIAGMEVTEHRHPQDGHFTRVIEEREVDFRVASSPVILGEKVVVRILRDERVLSGVAQLGMDEAQIRLVRDLMAKPYGLILASGPVGSGKTTTLYSLINEVNVHSKNVMTIEDPVEYRLRGISQMQADPHAKFGFIEGLRAILRQDPNVIMIGEIRDEETADTAVKAAMTGVLVLSSLHANDAPGTVGYLMELGVPRFAIASALMGVIAQRLVRKICPHCKEEYHPPESLREKVATPNALWEKPLYHGKGCEHCFNTGYLRRAGIFQIMPVTEEIKDAILRGERRAELQRLIREAGAQSLSQNALSAVQEGVTTLEEYLRVAFI